MKAIEQALMTKRVQRAYIIGLLIMVWVLLLRDFDIAWWLVVGLLVFTSFLAGRLWEQHNHLNM